MGKSVQFAGEKEEKEKRTHTHTHANRMWPNLGGFTLQQMLLDQINDLTTIMIRLIAV